MTNKHEKVAVIGMGKTGISVVHHLQRLNISCECFDEAKVTLPDDVADVPLHTGELNAEKLSQFDRIIVSPGINWRHPALISIRSCGVAVHGDLEEFLRHYQGALIAVTGTNGKTTTTQMIALMLETLPGGCEAGGNIGIPMLDLLEGQQPERVALELSSFQLERAKGLHPHWAALLNVQPDHADMHESQEAYKAAKVGMFENMIMGDVALLSVDAEWDDLQSVLSARGVEVSRFGIIDAKAEHNPSIKAGILCHGEKDKNSDVLFWTQDGERQSILCQTLMVRGYHQQQNIAVAAQAAADYGVSKVVIEEALMSFQGLEHRLEFVGNIGGRDWFNDSKATNPDAAVAALTSFEQVNWICGGLRKGLSLDGLRDVVKKHVSFACVVGKDSSAYVDLLKEAGVPYVISKTIEKAVKAAKEKGQDAILLSPAAASQDQFNNYADRGHAFVKAIRALSDDA
ncbi:MAG: UDP-N-acetylmuramoyl-L-alanine--D-glutamate ligase [Ghiorsea sp.]